MEGHKAVIDRAPSAGQRLNGEGRAAAVDPPGHLLNPATPSLQLGLNARLLPLPVRWFYLQALGTALRRNDRRTLAGAPSAEELARVLEAARGTELVVEIGARTGWITLALALAAERRKVISVGRVGDGLAGYAHLVEERVRARIGLYAAAAARAAGEMQGCADLVLVDATSADGMLASLSSAVQMIRAGGDLLVRGADSPQVRSVLGELGFEGPVADGLLLSHKPSEPEPGGSARATDRPHLGPVAYGFVGTVIGLAVALAGPKIGSITDDLPGTTGRDAGAHDQRLEQPGRQANRPPAVGRAAVRLGRGDPPKLFSGTATGSLGTFRVDVPTVLTWRSNGALSISSHDWRFQTRAHRGTTVLSPRTYGSVEVTAPKWKLRLEPTR
jgi:hypothetical protein